MQDVKKDAKPETFSSGAPMAPKRDDGLPGLDLVATWGARSLEELKCLGRRVFVHVVAVVCGAAAALSTGSIAAGLCTYIGSICLVARGISLTPAWILPAMAGIIQLVVLAALGLPLPQAVFWGGAQTWVQRLLQKRLNVGSEWGTLLLLLPMGIYLVGSAPALLLAGSFAAVGAVWAVVIQGVFRRQAILARAEALRLQGPPEPEKIAVYRSSLADFNGKVEKLPRSARPLGEAIVAATGNILKSMAEDPRDIEPGHRFLNRYFKAAHSVVDKQIALAREQTITPEIAEALTKGEEMLSRLGGVFAKEHARLLRNDVTDFSADLAVIDTLLKMDGR